MQSRTTRKFWRLFSDLPADAQRDASAPTVYSRAILLTQVCNSRNWKERITSIQFASV